MDNRCVAFQNHPKLSSPKSVLAASYRHEVLSMSMSAAPERTVSQNGQDRLAGVLYILAGIGLALFYIFGEKIQVINGLGWAGADFAIVIMQYPASLDTISAYQAHRILFPVLFAFLFKLFSLETTPGNIRAVFMILNIAALFLSLFLLRNITKRLHFSEKTSLFCLVAFLCNYGFSKFPSFYPVLTDWAAAPFFLLIVYYWLGDQPGRAALSWLAGAFIQPLILVGGAIFLLVPAKRRLPFSPAFFARLSRPVWIVASLGLVWLCAHFIAVGPAKGSGGALFAAGILGAGAYLLALLVLSLRVLAGPERGAQGLARPTAGQMAKSIALAAAVFLLSSVLVKLISHAPSPLSFGQYLANSFRYAANFPFAFVISQFLYFGPAYAVFLLLFPRLLRSSLDLGDAPLLFLAFFACATIDSESRHAMVFWPVVVVLIGKALQERQELFTAANAAIFIGLSLLLSQAWFPTGIYDDFSGDASAYPAQWYFMYHGPWMNLGPYLVLVGLLVLFGVYFAGQWNRTGDARGQAAATRLG
jgi:hypothetical protein